MQNIRLGDWKMVRLSATVWAIGYVTNMANHSVHGEQVTLTRVALFMDGKMKRVVPTVCDYSPFCLQPADGFWNEEELQDRSVLIVLALQTKDEQWFAELTGQVLQHEA